MKNRLNKKGVTTLIVELVVILILFLVLLIFFYIGVEETSVKTLNEKQRMAFCSDVIAKGNSLTETCNCIYFGGSCCKIIDQKEDVRLCSYKLGNKFLSIENE
jgi:hypothetical protein